MPSDALESEEFYRVLGRRRDVRAEFSGAPVDPTVLQRVLAAAHAAPSVGMTQPWDFLIVTDDERRRRFESHVRAQSELFNATLDDDARTTFGRIKIDGILESSLSIVVTYDATRGAPSVLGRHSIADTGLYSVCLAIENLWLACTHEGWGLGWVSFYEEDFLRDLLAIPDGLRPVAWLCVGPVSHHQKVPDLERLGWRPRVPLANVVHFDHWGTRDVRALSLEAPSIGGAVSPS